MENSTSSAAPTVVVESRKSQDKLPRPRTVWQETIEAPPARTFNGKGGVGGYLRHLGLRVGDATEYFTVYGIGPKPIGQTWWEKARRS